MAPIAPGISARDGLWAVVGGLVGAAAFPPLGLWPLALVAPCLFLLLIRQRTPAEGRNLGFLYGLTLALATMHWFFALFGPLAIALITLMGCYWGLLGTLIGMTRGRHLLVRAVLVALFAVGVEWLRGDAWYLRFPWYSATHALAAAPACVALTRWVGVHGLSFLVWMIAGCGAFGPRLAWGGFLLLPAFWWLLPAVEAPNRLALLVQAEGAGRADVVLARVPALKADLVVMPESAYGISPEAALHLPDGPAALARKVSAPVVFGAVKQDGHLDVFENVAGVVNADGKLLGTFTKQHPVPLFRDGVPGISRPVFPLDEGVLGVAICYDYDAPEVAASLVRQGATVLAAPTLDALSWGAVQHAHHELLLRLRAVEIDRWILRAASSGRSEAVSPHGVPSEEGLAIGEEGFVAVAFAHRSTRPLSVYAHVLGPIGAAGTALLLVLHGISRWRSRCGSRGAPAVG